MSNARPAHSVLGASSASRWLACPGSVSLSQGTQSASSVYAAEGQAAHALAEVCLRDASDPSAHLGTMISAGVQTFIVTDEMVDAVQLYLDLCRSLGNRSKFAEVEAQVDVNALWVAPEKPPADMFGTGDFIAWGRPDLSIHGVDFKYGKGVPVEVESNGELNVQMLYYLLGGVLKFSPKNRDRLRWAHMHIVQPRAEHPLGGVRSAAIHVLDLLHWGETVLKPGAEACFAPNPKFAVGQHCRWCPARGSCPALRDVAQKTARVEFDALPPGPVTLSGQELSDILEKAEIIKSFVDGVRAEASARLDRGTAVPGWKLVQKRGIRKWDDEAVVLETLLGSGVEKDNLVDTKLKSPTQIEKRLGKEIYAEVSDHVSKDSSGTTLVRELDPRQAASTGAASDFNALETDEC